MTVFQFVFCVFIAIIAVVILGFRDRARSKTLSKRLRERLMSRPRCSDSELILAFPLQKEKEIAVQFRERLSNALDVDAQTIHPDDDLHRDYHLDTLSPCLIAAIAAEFTHDSNKTGSQQILSYNSEYTKFRDFVRAIAQQLA